MKFFQKLFHKKVKRSKKLEHSSSAISSKMAKPQELVQTMPTPNESTDDDMAKDLAVLIGNAISLWTKKYHLESMPYDVVLDQVLSIISTIRNSL